jgi:hypothetical protein
LLQAKEKVPTQSFPSGFGIENFGHNTHVCTHQLFIPLPKLKMMPILLHQISCKREREEALPTYSSNNSINTDASFQICVVGCSQSSTREQSLESSVDWIL